MHGGHNFTILVLEKLIDFLSIQIKVLFELELSFLCY